MKILTLDTENTTHEYGNPFSIRNKCCIVPYLCVESDSTLSKRGFLPWEYDGPVSSEYINCLSAMVGDCELLIGFNLKYDLHWLRRYGIVAYSKLACRIWDTQLAQFIIQNQSVRMPSLDGTCEYWSLEKKSKVVEEEYWNKGLDTTDVPMPILSEYGMRDVDLTYQIYLKQQEYLKDKPKLAKLIRIANMDLLVLAEMEWNGLRYDVEESKKRSIMVEKDIAEIDETIKSIVGNYDFNFNSNDQLSCIVYGGTIKFRKAIPYEHTFKTTGLTKTRFKHEVTEVVFPRLATPSEKSKLKKDGYWSTDESSLTQLRVTGKAKELVSLLLKRAAFERLLSTYYVGFPKKMQEMDWPFGEIHSQLNQTVAITGRLSSSGPNQQNIPPEVYELVRSRYT